LYIRVVYNTNTMKAKLILIFFFLLSSSMKLSGQLTVNAGIDTIFCSGMGDLRLGGNPTASGGEEPYTYKWELLPVFVRDHRISTSRLINDSTSANPLLMSLSYSGLNDTVTFVLTVTDADSNSKNDSVKIIISTIGWRTLMGFVPTIILGDSVQLTPLNICNGIAPFSYHWTPEASLSDPYIRNPYAKPDTTTLYTCVVTDALGCSAHDHNHVWVIATGIPDLDKQENSSVIFPNPITLDSQIKITNYLNKKLNIKVVNMSGQVVLNDWFHSDSYNIGEKITKTGSYLYIIINNDDEILSRGIFSKQ
jgi:hypothetical protein